MHPAILLVAVLQGVGPGAETAAGDTLGLHADSAAMATAYRDEAARDLVRRARGRRDVIDASVFHYTALSRQRISVGIRALRRDRLLYRRETASAVEWWRDRPGRVEVLGAREAVPVALEGVQVPDDLEDWAREFVPRPGEDRLMLNPTDEGFAWHPLVEGGEALYQYASGDTTVIRLPDGREVRLAELRVTPREREFRRITGSFWIELDDYAVVQAVFRPARDFDLERDLPVMDPESDDADELPELLKPVQFAVRYITIEYGLWEMRWWMPRMVAFEGVLRMGGVRAPIGIEVVYSDYEVSADRYGLPELPPLVLQLAGDPDARARRYEPSIRVVVPDDTTSLLESSYLPPSIYSEAEPLISEAEIRQLGERLGDLPAPPWEVGRPRITWPWTAGRGLLRYNRVEGLSPGVRVDWDLSRLRMDMVARVGLADGVPRVEAGAEASGLRRQWRLAGYARRLVPANPGLRPLGIGNSATALLLGRDDGMYFEASGAEVVLSPADAGWYRVRAYGERQSAVQRATRFSLASTGGSFRENIEARRADQFGTSLRARLERGLDPTGARWGAWLDVTAETGTFTFLRPGVGVRGSAPLFAGLLGGVELAGGTTLSDEVPAAPPQGLWYLGGPATLRGFDGGALAGSDHVRGRAELSRGIPGVRVSLFSDAAWAGEFDDWETDDIAVSGGIGASALDGLLRMDLARTIRPVEQWRLELYVDALF